jgi:hypothetical protein
MQSKKEKEKYDAQKIINSAKSFILAADRCLEQRPLTSSQSEMLMIPSVVCRAFAIELYFKAILTIENKSATGHDLYKLFSLLSYDSQVALRANFSLGEYEFKQKIKDTSGVFVDWRYIYESQSANIDLGFLNKLTNACQILAESTMK